MKANWLIVGIGLAFLVLTPRSATAQDGSIGVYADLNATETQASFSVGTVTTLYIIATLDGQTADGMAGAEFRVVGLPPGWGAISTRNPDANVSLGDPFRQTGDFWRANVAFPTCQTGIDGLVLLYTVEVFPTSEVTEQLLTVEAGDPPSNPNFDVPLLNICDQNFSKVPVDGGQFTINEGVDYKVSPCDIGVSDPTPALGQEIQFQALVRNVGALDAPAPVLVRFLLDSLTVGADVPAGPIAAGDSVLVSSSLTWSANFDPHLLTVVVDPDTLQQESSRANNVADCPLPYELHPEAIPGCPPETPSMFSSCSPCVSDTVSIHAVVTNTGAFSVDSVQVEFRDLLGGVVTLGTVEVRDLGSRGNCPPTSSGSATLQHAFAFLGDHPIEVFVDPDDVWPEYDESNNGYQQTLEVACIPEIWFDYEVLPCDIGVSDATPALGQEIQFQALVRNVGALDAPAPVLVRFMLDSLTVGADVPAGPIAAGDSVLVSSSLTWSANFDPHLLTVVVDPDTLQQESSRTNNVADCPLPYELHPEAIPGCPPEAPSMFSSCSPCVGDTVSIHAVVTNTGAFSVDSVQVEFRDLLGGVVTLGTVEVRDLGSRGNCPPTSSGSATLQHAFAVLGDHPIEVFVDPDDVWPEYDEDNNGYQQTLEVACVRAPDLSVTSSDISPSRRRLDSGETLDFVEVRVRNIGLLEAVDVHLRLTIDGQALCEDLSLGNIAAAGEQLARCDNPWVAPDSLGDYVIEACADPGDAIPEAREDNNCGRSIITVGPPVPAVLTDLMAHSSEDGLLLQWKAQPDFAGFGIERRFAQELGWKHMTTIPVQRGEPSSYADYSFLDTSAVPGKTYEYRFLGLDQENEAQILGSVSALFSPPLPKEIVLQQNFPNPFNPVTRIRVAVPRRQNVSVRIFDSAGQSIVELWNGPLDPGYHTLTWNGRDSQGRAMTSGIYFSAMTGEHQRLVKKLVLLK